MKVIFSNKDILVVQKPFGISVHGTTNSLEGTFLEEVLKHAKKLSFLPGKERPGTVHRLDKDTSGVMVFAKTDKAYEWLIQEWKNHEVEKTYIVLVSGHLEPKKGAIEAPIGRRFHNRKKMGIMPSATMGKAAYTQYEVLEYFDEAALLKVKPKTGRTHQIRVHFKAIGHPVVGDEVYGDRKLNKKFAQEFGLERQFLHALSLKFRLPNTVKKRDFVSPLPHDLEKVLSLLRG